MYRRPLLVRQLVKKLEQTRPKKIWLFADGPKNPQEQSFVELARRAAEQEITWFCDVRRVYSTVNLGLRRRLETGLDLVFSCDPEAMIFEEDCHPTREFFPFCEEMLSRYRDEARVGCISGGCFLPKETETNTDYYFSRYSHIWGWATWARAWNSYDRQNWSWPQGGFRAFFPNAEKREIQYWNRIFHRLDTGEIDT